MQSVYKPWGHERWLELNEFYCLKEIFIRSGHRTSLQFHRVKTETNLVVSGQGVFLIDDESRRVGPGDFSTIYPGQVHRVIALSDLVLHEVSTPDVDDVVRLEDDTNRPDDLIGSEHSRPALCLLCAGMGSRMGSLTAKTNKVLLPLGGRAIISDLVDAVPDDFDVVVALGWQGDQVRSYLLSAHPGRSFAFVGVEDFSSVSSGPGVSLRSCAPYLRRPFVWAVGDCVLPDGIPPLDGNWIGVHRTSIPELYSTVRVVDGIVTEFSDKSVDGFDQAFVGVAGIHDFETFWSLLTDSEAITPFLSPSAFSSPLRARQVPWLDAGTVEGYERAMGSMPVGEPLSLEKVSGSMTYRSHGRVVKLFEDPSECGDRVERQKVLSSFLPGMVPPVHPQGESIFWYDWVPGSTLYDCSLAEQQEFVRLMHERVWKPSTPLGFAFVQTKLATRFPGGYPSAVAEMLKTLPIELLDNGLFSPGFHGDLQFDNVVKAENGFVLIDWRGRYDTTNGGDVYYDMAKLLGGALIDYSAIRRGVPSEPLSDFVDWYLSFLQDAGFSLEKIWIHVILVWATMSPLHPGPFGDLLIESARNIHKEMGL